MKRFQHVPQSLWLFLRRPPLPLMACISPTPMPARTAEAGASGAIFLQIENHADTDEILLDVKSDVAEKVELHSHKAGADGVMQMLRITDGVAIAALQSHELARGGDHIMLMGLKSALKDGDIIHLTLIFQHAGVVEIDLPVDNARKPSAMKDMAAKPLN